MSLTNVEEEQAKPSAKNTGYANKLIVNLKRDIKPEELEIAFVKYDLISLRRTNKTLNTWLFTYDGDSVKKKRLINLIKKT